jgi:hypothetical protein
MKTIEQNTLMTIDHNVNSTESKQTEHKKIHVKLPNIYLQSSFVYLHFSKC